MHPLSRILLTLATSTLAATASAQSWPAKPIRVVVPFPPGGGTDIIARDIIGKLARNTGWTLVADNKPGAGGNIGVDAAAKAAPDGYTIVLGQTSNLAINATLYSKLPYDPVKDLAPIGLVATAPLAIITASQSRLRTVQDLVSAAKAKPGEINFASPGNGTVAHLTGELFQRTAGVKFQHVPYRGANQALNDVIGGQVQIYVASVPSVLPQVRAGKLHAIAVTSAKRVDDLPQTPTVGESGYKGFDAITWWGFLAPAGTPKDVIARLNTEINKALQAPDLQKQLSDGGADPVSGGTPEQFAELIRKDIAAWGKTVRESGVKAE